MYHYIVPKFFDFAGKELSRIPMPVNFNEPLSMLQRLTEDLEYSSILDLAATMTDSREQLAAVAAFTGTNKCSFKCNL